MKTVIFLPLATPNERVEELNKICYNRGDETFNRTLTESELAVEKDNFISLLKSEEDLKDELKKTISEYQTRIKAIEEERKQSFTAINTGQLEVRDKLYWVIDFKNGNMNYFDRYGELIKSRKLTPDETNGQLFNNAGEAANSEGFLAIEHDQQYNGDVRDISDIEDVDFEESVGSFESENEIKEDEGGSDLEEKETPKDKKVSGTRKKSTKKNPE